MKHKNTKARYRLRNWREYNRALVQRGSLTLWFSAEVLTVWQSRERTGQRGHPRTYSDTAILTMATLQELSDRIERLVLRHDELKRTNALLEEKLSIVGSERDSLKSRLAAARSRIDALLERLPADSTKNDSREH